MGGATASIAARAFVGSGSGVARGLSGVGRVGTQTRPTGRGAPASRARSLFLHTMRSGPSRALAREDCASSTDPAQPTRGSLSANEELGKRRRDVR